IPIITTIGGRLGVVMAGSVLIESIFAIPGLGSYMLSAIYNRDYPIIQGGVLILAVFISIIMLITDIIYAFVDPRIKSKFKNQK
ncbi:MAG: ABC transporter permease subunit, partial [Firmicutes bacterium]|nr:ABC transporter permease subunit [Bacillota bacterium]